MFPVDIINSIDIKVNQRSFHCLGSPLPYLVHSQETAFKKKLQLQYNQENLYIKVYII